MIAPTRIFTGHTDAIRDLAFSPDGRLLASGSNDKTLRLWDAATGECRSFTQHTYLVTAVAFSPSGERLATASADRTARLWDPVTGACLATLEHRDTSAFPGDICGGLTALRFSRDGRLLATQTSAPSIHLWDLEAMTERRFEGLKKSRGASIDIAPDGRWLAASTHEKTARIWSTSTGKSRLLKGHTGKDSKVASVGFAPDGRFLATAARWDPATYLWDPATLAGTALTSIAPGAVTASNSEMAISPDASWLARANSDPTVELWDVSATSLAQAGRSLVGTSLKLHEVPVEALCFAPDSRLLASAHADGQVVVSEVPSGRSVVRATLAARPSAGVYSPDGRRIAFAVNHTVTIVDLDS